MGGIELKLVPDHAKYKYDIPIYGIFMGWLPNLWFLNLVTGKTTPGTGQIGRNDSREWLQYTLHCVPRTIIHVMAIWSKMSGVSSTIITANFSCSAGNG